MRLSFVIPILNEEESINILYSEIITEVKKQVWEYEIIFVDDGSTDKSFEVMKTIADSDNNVKVIRFRRNFGKAAALQTAFGIVKGEIVFTMDGDLQDNPKEIPNFVKKIEEGYDLVSGWKKVRKDPIEKRLPSKFYNTMLAKTYKVKLHDFNCGFKAYKREVVEELDIYGEMHRFIPALAAARGFKIAEIPVEHRKRSFGKSKYGIERYLRGGLDFLTVLMVTHFSHSPLYLFGGSGCWFMGAGFLINFYLTVMKLGFGYSLSNRPLLFLGSLLITIGVQLFAIGLIGELIVSQNRRQTKTKSVSIKEKINMGD